MDFKAARQRASAGLKHRQSVQGGRPERHASLRLPFNRSGRPQVPCRITCLCWMQVPCRCVICRLMSRLNVLEEVVDWRNVSTANLVSVVFCLRFFSFPYCMAVRCICHVALHLLLVSDVSSHFTKVCGRMLLQGPWLMRPLSVAHMLSLYGKRVLVAAESELHEVIVR